MHGGTLILILAIGAAMLAGAGLALGQRALRPPAT